MLLPLAPSSEAQKEVDPFGYGVLYFMATGSIQSGHFGFSPAYDGQGLLPIRGCGFAQLRPATETGVVTAAVLLDETNVVRISMSELAAPDSSEAAQGGVAVNTTLDGRIGRDGPSHPAVFARAAAWGKGTVDIDGNNFTNDDDEAQTFDGYFFLTRNGFRDNATKAVQTQSGSVYNPAQNDDAKPDADDWEMHMRFEEPSPAKATTQTYASPSEAPDGTIVYEEAHEARFKFDGREYFGGKADITITASSSAPPVGPGTDLRFQVISPGLQTLVNVTLKPSANQPGSHKVTLPITQYGDFEIRVNGRATATKYQVQVALTPPAKVDLNLWWDEIFFEKPAFNYMGDCESVLQTNLMPIPSGVGRGKGPGFNVELIAVSVAVSVVGVLFVVKLISDAVVTASFKSVFKR